MNKIGLNVTKKSYIFLMFMLIGAAIASVISYSFFINSEIEKTVKRTLSEIVSQQSSATKNQFQLELDFLNNVSSLIGSNSNLSREEILPIISQSALNSKFQTIAFFDMNGIGFSNNDVSLDISKRSYFSMFVENQKELISETEFLNDEYIIPIVVPVYGKDRAIIGGVVGGYSQKGLYMQIEKAYDGKSEVFFMNRDTMVFSSSITSNSSLMYANNNNFLYSDYLNENDLISLKNAINNNEEITLRHDINGVNYFSSFSPLGFNDWYIFTTISASTVGAESVEYFFVTIVFFIVLLIILMLLFLLFKKWKSSFEYHLRYSKTNDILTGLPNLETFKEEIDYILAKNGNYNYACHVFDISNFKMINEIYGKTVGDRVLTHVANTLKTELVDRKKNSTATRIHDDLFAIFYPVGEIYDDEINYTKFELSLKGQLKKYGINTIDFYQGRYITSKGESATLIIDNAKLSHSQSRKSKPNVQTEYSEEFKSELRAEADIVNNFQNSLDNDHFIVYLQKKMNLCSGKLEGYEALVRWKSFNNVHISPDKFIPVLEKRGLINQLDIYVFEKCCEEIKKLQHLDKNCHISVNFSRHNFADGDFVKKLIDIVNKHQVETKDFVIEITETTLFEKLDVLEEVVKKLQSFGFRVSIDDFGSGYSSISFLNKISIDEIKIDKSIIDTIETDSKSLIVLKNLIKMAKELKIRVVAEGVEKHGQLALLSDIECDLVQGYFIHRPEIINTIILDINN